MGCGGKGSGRGSGIRLPGGTAEKVGDSVNNGLVTGVAEGRGDPEGVESSRSNENSSRSISAVALLHTSQEGSGHNS